MEPSLPQTIVLVIRTHQEGFESVACIICMGDAVMPFLRFMGFLI